MDMTRLALIAAAAVWAGAALAQTPPALPALPSPPAAPTLGESAKKALGTWEFSNADRDKICTAVFSGDRTAVGFKVEFDKNCGSLFPLVNDVVGWTYPDNDLLNLLDAQGNALVEFSEVEDGIYEAPTPGVGVLFLQNPAAAGPAPKPPAEVAGDWAVMRTDGTPMCAFTLATKAVKDGMALTVKPGCDATIVQLKFTQWQLDRGELVLLPAQGIPWRFEEIDNTTWRRIPETVDSVTLVRQ
jgi:hypothetical protein